MSLQATYEQQLLGRIISDKAVYYENADIIHGDLFAIYGTIWESIDTIIKDGKQPTLTKLISKLPNEKQLLIDAAKGTDHSIPLGEIVDELDELRKVREINEAMTRASMEDDADEKIKTLTNAITGLVRTERSHFTSGYDIARQAVKELEKGRRVDVPTGFAYWDKLTGGINKSDLTIIAAETSQGKTSLALNITDNALQDRKAVAFISLEMTEGQLMTRMVCTRAKISSHQAEKNIAKIQEAASDYASAKLYVADVTNNNITHILGLIRSASIRFNVDMVVIDYLQLVGDRSHKSREQEVGHIARALKNIAKELNIGVVALSQLGRPRPGQTHVPTLSRLRDSGQIEEAADVVVFIYRPEVYGIKETESGSSTDGLAKIIIAKGRNYGTGQFTCEFEKDITQFRDWSHRDGPGSDYVHAESDSEAPF